jgi:glyoxylase-like metal-dependent hydrolase (beta-lactamase superfamily II)
MNVDLHVLKTGTIEKDADGNIVDASSSVTLVQAADVNIIVDTAMPFDAPEILAALEGHGLETDDVDMVVNTHGHHDHTGCNRLFGQAEVVLHKMEGAGRSGGGPVRHLDGETELVPGVRVIETPGHSRGSISVVAELEEGPWVMAGDALPTRDNFLAWVPPGIHFDPEVALDSMRRIVDIAWMIVPGHDVPFKKEGELPAGIMQLFTR